MTIRTLLAALLIAVSTMTSSAAPVFPRGGGVGLEPPPGMAVSTDFLGFRKGLSSILITELPPAAYAQIDASRARFAAKVEGGRIEDFAAGGAKGFIVRGRQTEGKRTFRKWAVVLGSPKATALVTAQIPTGEKDMTDAEIEASLRTIVLREQPDTATQVDALPFGVGDLAGFRIVRTIMGATMLLTEGPKDEDPEIAQPSVVIATSLNRPAPRENRVAFAKDYLMSLKPLSNIAIQSADLVTQQGAEWAKVRATATRGRANVPVEVSLFIRFGEGDFIAVVGTAPTSKPSFADRFRQLAQSVSPRG